MNKNNLILSVLLFLSCTSLAIAKEIKLYDQPQQDAKVIGTVDSSIGVVPIFTPKTGDWMKVGDPRNGNVGWVKSNDFINNGSPTSFTFTQRIINDGKGPHTYQVIEYGKPENLTGEQLQAMMQKMQVQQKNVQQHMQKIIQNMVKEMNEFYQQPFMQNIPMIMPIVILPAQKTEPAKPVVTPQENKQSKKQ